MLLEISENTAENTGEQKLECTERSLYNFMCITAWILDLDISC